MFDKASLKLGLDKAVLQSIGKAEQNSNSNVCNELININVNKQ